MVVRRPLVAVAGVVGELPAADTLAGFHTPYGFEIARVAGGAIPAAQYKASGIADTTVRNDGCTVHDLNTGMVIIPVAGWWTFSWVAASLTNTDDKAAIWQATTSTATPTVLFEGTRDGGTSQKVMACPVVYVPAGTFVMPGLRTGSLQLTATRFAGALVQRTA